MDPHKNKPYLVGARVDKLCIAYTLPVSPARLTDLQRAKGRGAQTATVRIGRDDFAVEPVGKRGKPFSVVNPCGHVFVGEQQVIVELAVPFLAANSVAESVERARAYAEELRASDGDVERAEVRKIDLCADLAGATFTEADRGAFVGRFRESQSWQTNTNRTRFTGLLIGSREALQMAIYDKTAELAQKHGATSERMNAEHARWRENGWNGRGAVWRVEARARGKVLTEYELRDPLTLPERIDPAWQRFTRRELRLVDRSSATRRERCRLDPRWEAIQGAAFVRPGASPAERVRLPAIGATPAQATGSIVSMLASRGRVSRSKAEQALAAFLVDVGEHEEIPTLAARCAAAWARYRGAHD